MQRKGTNQPVSLPDPWSLSWQLGGRHTEFGLLERRGQVFEDYTA